MRSNADLYDDPRDEERRRRRRDDDEPSSYSSRDRGEKDRKEKDRDRDRDKDKREKRKSRSEAGGSRPQEIVDRPRRGTRSVSGQIEGGGVVPYTASSGPPMMSGALPAGTMSSHVPDQFPGQDPAQFARPFMPGPVHTNSFGEAAEYYGDMGDSVQHQPGVRPDRPSVIMPLDTPHLMSATSQANPVADTGSGAAADFYGTANIESPPTKPPRPSTMPGAFTEDEPSPQKPPRPSSKPGKPGKIGSAATLAGVAGLGYAIGHSSSSEQQTSYTQHSTSYTNGAHGVPGASAGMYYQGDNTSIAATDGSIPTYSEAMGGAPPQKPPRPFKPEKQPSGSSHAGLYAAGAAGLATYGLAHHSSNSNSHSQSHHNHTSSMPGGFPSDQFGGPSASPFMAGGMAHMHEHKGPVTKFADWWKNHEDVAKMEEYTEFIGVCRGCFDPRSSSMDAPRKHHYNRKRSGEFRPSGIQGKQSRYGLNEKASRYSLSGDEKRDKRKSSSAAGWIAAGLGGVGLASAGKALLNQRNDFDDTYSVKSGHDARSRVSRRSRSRSRDRKHHSSGRSEIRHRSRSWDRMSRMSTGVTGDRKDYKIVRHRSHSRSRSRSRDRKSGLLGAAVGAGLAASAVSASRRKHRSRSRSRSNSPQKVFVHHRRESSDHDRKHSKTHRVTHKSSRSSAGSFVDVSRTSTQQSQSGFLGGFFAAPPPKEKRRKSSTHTKKKKKKGFFNFGNDSTSSSGSELAFGAGYVKRKQRPSRRSSDEKLNATLVGLGATAAAIAAAQAGRNKGKHRPEIVAVRERRDHRHSGDRRRLSASSRYGSENADGWEDLPDDETSDSGGSISSGLAFGDYDWKKGKSTDSLVSNDSGTNKWGWRWGSKKQKKKPSSESLYNTGANTSVIGPAAVGTVAGAAIGAGPSRHDSSTSSQTTLQSVYPVASNDPTSFDARRTSAIQTPQPLITSRPDPISIQQPQPMQQVPGAIYSTQGPPQPGYVVPSGPPVFAQYPAQHPYPLEQHQTGFVEAPQHPPLPRRSNSSPIQSSSWKRDAAIAGIAAGIGAGAVAAMKKSDQSSSSSNVRFDFTPEQAKREEREERERRKERDRESDSDRRRRKDEEDRKEQERRRIELQRQQDEARKYIEAEQLAKIELERREATRKREREQRRTREAREAEERERHEREARAQAQRRTNLEAEAEQMRRERQEADRRETERYAVLERAAEQKRRERQEAERREAEQREAAERRELEIRADTERKRREREVEGYSQRYESDLDRRTLEHQRTGSSVASDVRRKERELQERERDIVQPDTWKSTAAAATVAGAAAAITSAAISSSKRDGRNVKTISPPVKHVEPSKIAQDYADEDIFDPNIFKRKPKTPSNVPQVGSAYGVLQDWEDRYKKKEPVSQADFFAPKELLDHSAPSPKIDPTGDTDIHVYQAHDDFDLGPPKTPPYPPSYSFTATKDGRGPPSSTWSVPAVPVLNLIQPTPPGSTANSVRGVSLPPSPAIEPVPDPKKESPKQDEANRRGSRVSWGENQFHNYEVPTPDSYRESFMSDRDLQDHSKKQAHDEIMVEAGSPKSGKTVSSYRPQQEPEYPSSTQFVPGQEEDSWAGTMSKKASKKDKKKAKAAVAAAAVAATTAAVLSRDEKRDSSRDRDEKRDTPFTVSDPFTDKYATSSVQSSVPSTSSAYRSPHYDSVEDVAALPSKPKGVLGENITMEPAPIHIPGSFDDDPAPSPPAEDEWATTSKKSKKGKKGKKPKTTEDDFSTQDTPKTVEPETEPFPDLEPAKDPTPEPEFKLSKKDKKKKKGKSTDDYFTPESPKTIEPTWTPEPEPVREPTRESTPEPEKPEEDEWAVPTKKGKKGKKSKSTDVDFFAPDVPNVPEPEPVFAPELVKETVPEPEFKRSKKDKKKKGKAAKRESTDNWDESESSQPGTPPFEREVGDVEPSYLACTPPRPAESSYEGGIDLGTSRSSGSSSTATKAAMAGDFAGLVASAMKQDQDRMASDLEHARKNMDSANEYSASNETLSTSNGTRGLSESEPRISIPSTAFDELADVADVKTPKKKRHSSGKWSPSVGSPLRSEVQYEDYVGAPLDSTVSKDELFMGPPKAPVDLGLSDIAPATSRDVHDSGYYAPDDQARVEAADRDSDEFFSAGSDDRKKSKAKSPSSDRYDDRDARSVVSSGSKYDDELDREERRRRRREERSPSRDRGYELDDGERKRRHRRRETDEQDDDWDSKSTISEARSEANGERRRKHKRRESERNGSPEDRIRSSATSDPGDLYERKSSKRRSKRDGDDENISIASSPARYDEERNSSKKDKEKRSSGLFGLFSKSKESLVDTSSKSSRSKSRDEDEDDERRRRRKKKERGSTYGSDDDDTRSVVSTSSRRSEKRRSSTRDDDGRKV
ncbi:hypothetical protein K458DRAFT_332495 [Lentithecium fluviatile CBS 122367]|uniref:Involucrin repeat protein n=1 Tax=Lentithecium fluviatile CBS 122367 TaxID=1168545 RepID=A0A6G1JC15_9PLEO|nr:hypothetical protein K458DRAFT_332495 [Lentithecium fluviatile CBS 122367]